MKKLLILLLLSALHIVEAKNESSLIDLELDQAFASAQYKINSISSVYMMSAYARLGFILDESQLLYFGKGGAVSTATFNNPAPAPYFFATEFVGYEYIVPTGMFIDLGLIFEVGSLGLGDGTTTALGATTEGTVCAIINLSQSIKIQIGYGMRYTFFNAADLTALSLTKADVDTTYWSLSVDVGDF